MTKIDARLLRRMARTYLWWEDPRVAAAMPRRVIARVMDIGSFDDARRIADAVGTAVLRDILARAEAGQFRPRSWTYWHYRLGLARLDHVPPLPGRKVAFYGSIRTGRAERAILVTSAKSVRAIPAGRVLARALAAKRRA